MLSVDQRSFAQFLPGGLIGQLQVAGGGAEKVELQ